jgi:hypothetical protein
MARFDLGRLRNLASQSVTVIAIAMIVAGLGAAPKSAVAQRDGGGGGGGGGGGAGGGGTIGTGATSGVAVDANGVLQRVLINDPTGALSRQRIQQAMTRLEGNLAKPSKLRKVSLTRLERLVQQRLAEGHSLDDAMLHLAGLTRLQYVFCYPESGDIVIAGPAEPWAQAPSGRMLAIDTGRPVLELQDLIVALRAFPPGADRDKPFIYCSIDPTPEGLARMQEFLRAYGSAPRVFHDTQFIVSNLQQSLGMQIITVGGVSPKTHFAQVLVEADYRMKLIGIGLENPPVRLRNYVERANPSQIARNALQRWYFMPDYKCVRVSDDALAMQLVGDGVKLVGENEVVGKDGKRVVSTGGNSASDAFVRAFTQVYPQLAERAPVYAQLRNCIDMAVAAAFIQHQEYYEAVGWKAETFRSEQAYAVETLNPPTQVETAVNAMVKGSTLLTPVGGGVQMHPTLALDSQNVMADEEKAVAKARSEVDLSKLRPDQWWWD